MRNFCINLLPLLFVWGIGALIYSNSMHGQFQFDDMGYVARNDAIRDIKDIGAIWNALNHPTRFLGFISFAINFHFHHNEVYGYHMTNMIIHLIGSGMVLWFVRLLFRTPRVESLNGVSKEVYDNRYWICSFIALLFVAHPMATQAVSYIAQRLASMATLFYVTSLCFYLKGRLAKDKVIVKRLWLFGFGFFALCGMFTKQITFTIPFMVILLELYFLNNDDNPLNKFKSFLKLKYILPFCISLLLVPWMMHFGFAAIFQANIASGSHIGDTITFWNYFPTQMTVVPHYIRLLFIPIGQNLDYDWQVVGGILELKPLLGFLFLASVLFFAIKSFKKNIFLSFGIVWFFLTASIESSIIPIRHVIFEHRVYLPLIGFCIFLIPVLFKLLRNKFIFIAVSCALIATCGYLTYERNKVWLNHFTMWSDVKKNYPDKARPYNNLAIYYLERQENDEALVELNQALELDPNFAEALNNRGVVYKRRGLYELALKDLDRAIEINPSYIDAFYNRGNAYHYSGRYEESLESFAEVLKINEKFTEAYNELGIVYKKMRKYDKSIEMYNEALKRVPTYADAIYNRGNVYYIMKDYDKALADFSKALRYKANFVEAYNQRGVVLRQLKRYNEALQDFQRAIQVSPGDVMAYYNRAKILILGKKFDLALADLTKAIEINPKLKEAYNERGIIYKNQKKYQLAYEDFSKAIAIDPNYVDAYNNRGNALTGTGQYDEAIADYDKAIKARPSFATSYYNRGLIMDYKGDWKESFKMYNTTVKFNPKLAIAYWKRGNAHRNLKRYTEAMEDVLKAQSMGFQVNHVYLKKLENDITNAAKGLEEADVINVIDKKDVKKKRKKKKK
ncbi:MAG: tetratricopeptide (TPR) repeat protein [Candidatus Omnitrophota bacterium]|jgi:tetratricopeptide (TPR) repeat protein